jgi:hypothetical protein
MSVLALELALMRALSLRFWHHFAYLIIGVALLGFGASGTAITLLRRKILARPRAWLAGLGAAFSFSIPLSLRLLRSVPLELEFLAWDLPQLRNLLLLELLLFVPFFLGAAVIGVALLDRPERITGHYVANLVGSGVGAIGAVAMMYLLTVPELLVATAAAGYLGAAALFPWRRAAGAVLGVAAAAGISLLAWLAPYEPEVSQYKELNVRLHSKGTHLMHRREGPLGRIDVVGGPGVHDAPCLGPGAIMYLGSWRRAALLLDGEMLGVVHDCKRRQDWEFMDFTTQALPYALRSRPRVLIVGSAGGAEIGLALFHRSQTIVALEGNPQIVEMMRGLLLRRGGRIYQAEGVEVVVSEARGYLSAGERRFDVIQVAPPGDAAAGLRAIQECYLYTKESFIAMFDRLSETGLLCLTASRQRPPRQELRLLDTAAAALRARGWDPRRHIAMIRGMLDVSVLVSKRPFTTDELAAIPAFCQDNRRQFDLCYLPGMERPRAATDGQPDRPYYFEAARDLLGEQRKQFLANYVFDVAATSDDKPYFFHFFRWESLDFLTEKLRGYSRAFMELGYLILIAAIAQAVVVAALMILLPLVPGIRALRAARRRAASLGYFLMIGIGFMLLEMGFLQKLVLYLADPIYSASVVISSFLIFAGLGSLLSQRWRGSLRRTVSIAGAAVVLAGVVYLFALDGWLALTQSWSIPLRFLIAAATIAPLALAMGHMFPAALRQVGTAAPALVPWAWAANGFASVVATVGAPLIAIHWGFFILTVIALVCYAAASALGRILPALGE